MQMEQECQPVSLMEMSIRAGQQLLLVLSVMALCTSLYLLLALAERLLSNAVDREKKE